MAIEMSITEVRHRYVSAFRTGFTLFFRPLKLIYSLLRALRAELGPPAPPAVATLSSGWPIRTASTVAPHSSPGHSNAPSCAAIGSSPYGTTTPPVPGFSPCFSCSRAKSFCQQSTKRCPGAAWPRATPPFSYAPPTPFAHPRAGPRRHSQHRTTPLLPPSNSAAVWLMTLALTSVATKGLL
jgi:hypothetical protein